MSDGEHLMDEDSFVAKTVAVGSFRADIDLTLSDVDSSFYSEVVAFRNARVLMKITKLFNDIQNYETILSNECFGSNTLII